jgi:hypothetical protein
VLGVASLAMAVVTWLGLRRHDEPLNVSRV